MSPLWRDRLQVFFSSSQVVLVRSRGRMKSKSPSRISARCECRAGGLAWESPLDQLDQMMAGAEGAEMTITISNRLVRYAVLPGQENIANPDELRAYAAFQMHEIYGKRTAAWMLGMSTWDPCTGGVCAAIERSLFERLEDTAARHRIRLKYIEPYFTSAFDRWHKRFNGGRTWFALVETGYLCLALIENGAWQRISTRRVTHVTEDELIAALDQEAILFSRHPEAVEQVYLLAPEHPQLALAEDRSWRTVSLHGTEMPLPMHYPVAGPAGDGKTDA